MPLCPPPKTSTCCGKRPIADLTAEERKLLQLLDEIEARQAGRRGQIA